MEKKTTEVYIGGRALTLQSDEDPVYMQKLAAYLNGKLGDLQKQVPHFDKRPSDFQYQMLVLNVADDFFKVRSQADASAEKITSMEQTLYDLKHELVTTKMQLEHAEKEAAEWKSALDEQGKRLDELRESFFKHKSN